MGYTVNLTTLNSSDLTDKERRIILVETAIYMLSEGCPALTDNPINHLADCIEEALKIEKDGNTGT